MAQDNQAHILQLPAELMLNIAEYLCLTEVGNFRKASKGINEKIKFLFFKGLAKSTQEVRISTIFSTYTSYQELSKPEKKEFLELLFKVMLDCLETCPEASCKLVSLSDYMRLDVEDLNELGEPVANLFRFLTQPIEDTSEENEAVMLNCISGLNESDYSERQRQDLELSIRATFAFLRREANVTQGSIYKNLAGANLEGASLKGANLDGANLAGADLRRATFKGASFVRTNLSHAVLFDDSSLENFIHRVEESKRSDLARILPLLLAINAEQLDKIDLPQKLFNLIDVSVDFLIILLSRIHSIEELNNLFDKVKNQDNIFSYSRNDVEDIYPEVLSRIAYAYLGNRLECHDEHVEKAFKERLIQEINKQKSSLYYGNKERNKWNELLEGISTAEPKFNNPSNRQRMQQT